MDIRVSGHQIDTGEALRGLVDSRLHAIADKYFSRAISAQVTFGRGPYDHSFTCDIVAYVPQGVVLKGSAGAVHAPAAFELAADRIETQLRRYKRRLKDRHSARANGNGIDAPSYVIEAPSHDDDEVTEFNPVIVAESTTVLKQLSVSEAVMELDMTGAPVVVFRHASHGRVNLVYRRPDGNIGWIDPPIPAH